MTQENSCEKHFSFLENMFKVRLTVYALLIFSSNGQDNLFRSYKFNSTGKIMSYAAMPDAVPKELKEFTLCVWSQADPRDKTPRSKGIFTYNVNKCENCITTFIKHSKIAVFHVKGESKLISFKHNVNNWLHTCFSWSHRDHLMSFYVNGKKFPYAISDYTRRPQIAAHGTVIIGQDQDLDKRGRVARRFERGQSFTGLISEVHLWNRRLSDSSISNVYRCKNVAGNVINWNESEWSLYNVTVEYVKLPCKK